MSQTVAPRSRPDLLHLTACGLILANVWRIQQIVPGLSAVKLPTLLLAAAIGLFVLDTDPRRQLRLVAATPPFKLLMLLLGLVLGGIPAGLYPGKTFSFLTVDYLPGIAALIITCASVRDRADLDRFVITYVTGAFYYAYYVYTHFSLGAGGRLNDLIYYDSNDFGLLLVCALPLSLYLLLALQSWRRIPVALALGFFLRLIIMSGSRGAFIGLVATGTYVLLRFTAIHPGKRLGAVVGALIVMRLFGSASYWAQMATILNPKDDYNWSGNSESGRMEVWKRGMGYMAQRPVLGVGASNFSVAEGMLSERGRENAEGGAGFKWSAAHNSFVQIGAETGVFGLLAFVGMLGGGLRSLGRLRRSLTERVKGRAPQFAMLASAASATVIGYASAGFFVSAGYAPIFLFVMTLIIGIEKIAPSETSPALRAFVAEPRIIRVPGMRGGAARVDLSIAANRASEHIG